MLDTEEKIKTTPPKHPLETHSDIFTVIYELLDEKTRSAIPLTSKSLLTASKVTSRSILQKYHVNFKEEKKDEAILLLKFIEMILYYKWSNEAKLREKQVSKAITLLNSYSNNSWAHYYLGLIYLFKNDFTKASQAFREAISKATEKTESMEFIQDVSHIALGLISLNKALQKKLKITCLVFTSPSAIDEALSKKDDSLIQDLDAAMKHFNSVKRYGIELVKKRQAEIYLTNTKYYNPALAQKMLEDILNRHDDPEAMFLLAGLCADGISRYDPKVVEQQKEDPCKTLAYWTSETGRTYFIEDTPKAVELLERAAVLNYPPALTKLGLAYRDGNLSKEPDAEKAVKLLKRAIDKGDISAFFELENSFKHGKGCIPQRDESLQALEEEIRKSAINGNTQHMRICAIKYNRRLEEREQLAYYTLSMSMFALPLGMTFGMAIAVDTFCEIFRSNTGAPLASEESAKILLSVSTISRAASLRP